MRHILALTIMAPAVCIWGMAFSAAAQPPLSEAQTQILQTQVVEASKVSDWEVVRRALEEQPELLWSCVRASGQGGDDKCPAQGGFQGIRLASVVLINAAASNGNADLLPLLLRSGAGVNARSSQGVPALLLALGARNDAMFIAMLGVGADINRPGPHGLTALHVAVARGDTALADRLLAAGAIPAADARGHMPGYYLFWQNDGDPDLAVSAQRLGYGEAHEYVARKLRREQSDADLAQFAQVMLQALGTVVVEHQRIQAQQQPTLQQGAMQPGIRDDPFAASTQVQQPQAPPLAMNPWLSDDTRDDAVVANNSVVASNGAQRTAGLCYIDQDSRIILEADTTNFIDPDLVHPYICGTRPSGAGGTGPLHTMELNLSDEMQIPVLVCGTTFYISVDSLNRSARSPRKLSLDGWRNLKFVVTRPTYDTITRNGQKLAVEKHVVSCPASIPEIELFLRGGR